MKGKKMTAPVVILAILILAGAIGGYCLYNQEMFNGARIKNLDCYRLSFTKMNQTDEHVLALEKGDLLQVDVEIRKGHLDLFIVRDGGDALYTGNDMDKGSFELTAPETGEYRITVKAKHAAGSIDIEVKN